MTLVELLIAVTLVAMLSVGMLFAIRVGMNAMERSNDHMLANRKVVSVQRILEGQVAGIMPVIANCAGQRIAFFQGETETMRFASSYSMADAWRGYPVILEFQVIPGENNQGVRLVVNESLYSGPGSAGAACSVAGPEGPRFQPVAVGPGSFVLADKLAYCRLSYREALPPPEMARWVARWSKPAILPMAIRVEMAPLAPDAARLQLQTLTIPLHVNRYPLERYDF